MSTGMQQQDYILRTEAISRVGTIYLKRSVLEMMNDDIKACLETMFLPKPQFDFEQTAQ